MNNWIGYRPGAICMVICLFFSTGCAPLTAPEQALRHGARIPSATSLEPVQVSYQTLAPDDRRCLEHFVAHDLAHVTQTSDGSVRMFEANGSGLALGDLDSDGDLDLVLGGQDGPNTLLWNEGALQFQRMPFGEGRTRAITIVDVAGDGRNDIVLTRSDGTLNYWRNLGDKTFAHELLPGVVAPAYVLNWADTDADGDLDLVTAPYDAGFLTDRGADYLLYGGSPVIHYENRQGRFVPEPLTMGGQALALLVEDINADGLPDILVGNDFAVPDYVWLRTEVGWLPSSPFPATNHSTMSLAMGDVDNDGSPELFGSDMKPYTQDPGTIAAWAPLMAGMDAAHPPGDPQIMENVFQSRSQDGNWRNVARDWGIEGTGWSWSGGFGDLDGDGYLDLYVVNGMIESDLFDHLPDHELVEENQAFRNQAGLRFEPAPTWRLGSTRSGRSMAMADLDSDGDLDIVVNNLRAAAQLFENRLCGGGNLQVSLHSPSIQNRRAIGARLVLTTDFGTLVRRVDAAGGYLSGNAAQVHFGFPAGTELGQLEILWPDGGRSLVDELTAGVKIIVERTGESKS